MVATRARSLPSAHRPQKTRSDGIDVVPKRGYKRMRTELEVHEGVDMFKERLTDDDKRHVNGQTLRAKAATIVTFASEYVFPVVKKPPKRGRTKRQKPRQAGTSSEEARRGSGRPKTLILEAVQTKHCYVLFVKNNVMLLRQVCELPDALGSLLKKVDKFTNLYEDLRPMMESDSQRVVDNWILRLIDTEEQDANVKMIHRIVKLA